MRRALTGWHLADLPAGADPPAGAAAAPAPAPRPHHYPAAPPRCAHHVAAHRAQASARSTTIALPAVAGRLRLIASSPDLDDGSGRTGQPLLAPSVRPPMNCFCSAK